MSGFSRVINFLALGALVGAAVAVYLIKYESAWQAEEVSRLERSIAREKTVIALLKAEWSQLARPDRIQALAEKHLALAPADRKTGQRVDPATLPMRPQRTDMIAEALASLGDVEVPIVVEAQDDPIGRAIESLGLPDADTPISTGQIDQLLNSDTWNEPTTGSAPQVSPRDSGDAQ